MSEVQVLELPYGRTRLPLHVPPENLLAVVEPAEVAPAVDPAAEVRRALREPVGSRPLSELVRPGQKVLIIIDDNTRPTPQHQVLPPVLAELASVTRNLHLKILIATGTHRAMTPEEIRAKVGAEIASQHTILNHDWANEANLVELGITHNGTPIKVNRLVQEADLVLAIGATVPHCLAGWGGGAKIVQPGVCGKDTTNMTHALNMISPMSHPGDQGSLCLRADRQARWRRHPCHALPGRDRRESRARPEHGGRRRLALQADATGGGPTGYRGLGGHQHCRGRRAGQRAGLGERLLRWAERSRPGDPGAPARPQPDGRAPASLRAAGPTGQGDRDHPRRGNLPCVGQQAA